MWHIESAQVAREHLAEVQQRVAALERQGDDAAAQEAWNRRYFAARRAEEAGPAPLPFAGWREAWAPSPSASPSGLGGRSPYRKAIPPPGSTRGTPAEAAPAGLGEPRGPRGAAPEAQRLKCSCLCSKTHGIKGAYGACAEPCHQR